jgi:hypothetical protein
MSQPREQPSGLLAIVPNYVSSGTAALARSALVGAKAECAGISPDPAGPSQLDELRKENGSASCTAKEPIGHRPRRHPRPARRARQRHGAEPSSGVRRRLIQHVQSR